MKRLRDTSTEPHLVREGAGLKSTLTSESDARGPGAMFSFESSGWEATIPKCYTSHSLTASNSPW